MKPNNNDQYKTTKTKTQVPLDGFSGSPLIHKPTALRDLTTRLNILERSGRSEPGTVNAGNISGTWLTGVGGGGSAQKSMPDTNHGHMT